MAAYKARRQLFCRPKKQEKDIIHIQNERQRSKGFAHVK